MKCCGIEANKVESKDGKDTYYCTECSRNLEVENPLAKTNQPILFKDNYPIINPERDGIILLLSQHELHSGISGAIREGWILERIGRTEGGFTEIFFKRD